MIQKADFWSGLAWLLVAAFLVWQGQILGLGRLNDPGSGFAVFWIGLLLALFSLSVIASSARGPGPAIADLWIGARWGRILAVAIMFVVYAVAFEPLGFVAASTTMLLFLMLVIDRVRLPVALPIAIIAPMFVWVALTRWLKIQLPSGILAPLLG